MDTRKLFVSGDAHELRTEDGNMVATADNRLVQRTPEETRQNIRELAKRWNAYPELVRALKVAQDLIAAIQRDDECLSDEVDAAEKQIRDIEI